MQITHKLREDFFLTSQALMRCELYSRMACLIAVMGTYFSTLIFSVSVSHCGRKCIIFLRTKSSKRFSNIKHTNLIVSQVIVLKILTRQNRHSFVHWLPCYIFLINLSDKSIILFKTNFPSNIHSNKKVPSICLFLE